MQLALFRLGFLALLPLRRVLSFLFPLLAEIQKSLDLVECARRVTLAPSSVGAFSLEPLRGRFERPTGERFFSFLDMQSGRVGQAAVASR